jgi:multidrug efflux system membrane fusion protein
VLAEAQTALEDSSLRAPFDGWIVKRSVDVGALVGPSVAGFTIADTKSVRAVFGVPDNAIGRVKLGQRQTITTDVFPEAFAGRVTAISPAADPKSRVYSVEVTVPNPKNQLKAGMIASLAMGGKILPSSVLAVPLSAVIRDPQNPEAFAVLLAEGSGDPATVRSRSVELGDAYGNMIQVLGGVNAGDRVVTSGSTLVKSGEKVRVIQ